MMFGEMIQTHRAIHQSIMGVHIKPRDALEKRHGRLATRAMGAD